MFENKNIALSLNATILPIQKSPKPVNYLFVSEK